jgi:hypothetical protein
VAAFGGTALLVTVVVGSSIAAVQLSPDDVGLKLVGASTATALGPAQRRAIPDHSRFFNALAGGQAVGYSGGSEPADQINPAAVAAMVEK